MFTGVQGNFAPVKILSFLKEFNANKVWWSEAWNIPPPPKKQQQQNSSLPSNKTNILQVARAWRETTPVCSRLTRLVRVGYSRHDYGASRERTQIMRRAQDGSVHMQRSLPSSSYPARSTLRAIMFESCIFDSLVYSLSTCSYANFPLEIY